MVRGSFGERRLLLMTALIAAAVTTSAGCVKRRYTIRTDPPGALVFVNNEELGPTPVSRSFTYYGDREILLIAPDGTQKKIIQPLPAPLYDNVLTDFVTENLLPITFRDERDFFYKIEPMQPPDTEGLRQRAEGLRAQGSVPPPPRPKKPSEIVKEWIFGPS